MAPGSSRIVGGAFRAGAGGVGVQCGPQAELTLAPQLGRRGRRQRGRHEFAAPARSHRGSDRSGSARSSSRLPTNLPLVGTAVEFRVKVKVASWATYMGRPAGACPSGSSPQAQHDRPACRFAHARHTHRYTQTHDSTHTRSVHMHRPTSHADSA